MRSAGVLLSVLLAVDSFAGRVVSWGDNDAGQTNVPPNLSNVVAIAAGNWHTLALKADGTLVAWGGEGGYNYGQGIVPEGLAGVKAIACGFWHNVALLENGSVVSWGYNSFGQTNVPPSVTNAIAIGAGSSHSFAIRRNGSVVSWGNNSDLQTLVPVSLRTVTAVTGGSIHSLALKMDGSIATWGYGPGRNIPAELTNVIAMASGQDCSAALQADGTVHTWGYNYDYPLSPPPGLSNVVAIAARVVHMLALRRDQTIVGWGYDGFGQASVPEGVTNVVAIAVGGRHSVALIEDDPEPTIVRQPLAVPVYERNPVLMSAGVLAGDTQTYQWKQDGEDLPNATNTWLKIDASTGLTHGTYTLSVVTGTSAITTEPTLLRVIRSQSLLHPHQANGVVTLTFGNEDGRPHSLEDAPFYKIQTIPVLPPGQRNIWRDLNLPFSLSDGRFTVSDPIDIDTNRFYRVVGRL